MNVIKYPTTEEVDQYIGQKEPLLVLISFDAETIIISHLDDAMEHHILLAKVGFKSTDIDKYFRIVLDDTGADWTFACPPDYKGITNKDRRISEFYKDGFNVIPIALQYLGYLVGINIPKRYQRHLKME